MLAALLLNIEVAADSAKLDDADIVGAAILPAAQVVFIAAAYSPAKHQAALRKIGAPGLPAAAAAARLPGQASSSSSNAAITFISPAQQQQQQQQQQQDAGSGQAAAGCGAGQLRLQQLYLQVEAAARQLLDQQQQQHLTVVLDSLCVLSSLVCEEQQAAALLHQLAALGEVLQVRAAMEGAVNTLCLSYHLCLVVARGCFLGFKVQSASCLPGAQQCLVHTYD
jgi:hypothetical protein